MGKKERLQAIMAQQQALVDNAGMGKRDLNAEEQAQFDEYQRQIDELLRELNSVPEPEKKSADDAQTREMAIAAERQRTAEITAFCRDFEADPQDFIKNGASVDEVRAAILEKLRKTCAPVSVRMTQDENDKYRAAAVDALLMRAGLPVEKPDAGAREMLGMSIRDLAIESLSRDGVSGVSRMSNDELYSDLSRQFYNPSAAFPSIMDQTLRKAYEAGYNQVKTTYALWTSRGVLTDFKTTQSNYLAGNAGEFLLVPENGELKHDLPKDTKLPVRKLQTYGRQFTMTRQAFIDDDIGFLTTIPARYAHSARTTINRQVYQILYDNPVIYDGVALFDTSHGNVADAGTQVTAESLQAMMLKLQLQKDPFGNPVIIRPAYLLVPVGYGFTMYTLLNSPTLHTGGNTQAVNPLYNLGLEVIEDPTLNALGGGGDLPWFLVADRGDAKSIQIDYLNGQEIPTIRRSERPGTLGFVWDIYLDWGITVVDYRGIVKNPGKPLSL